MRVITIQVHPRSNRDEVIQTGKDTFDVRVKAMPEKGKANKDAIKELAHFLGMPQSNLLLTKGEKFQEKTILVLEE
ncbi:DUF167 domain-containing protein [Candidatus Woesebacteria bacterium]|nr:DUF167 domain-containing protein [Candidatus Woesebacteria bacterium]